MARKTTTKAGDEKLNLKPTNTDVNVRTETVNGPSVEDARDGTTTLQNRLDQNIPAGKDAEFDPEAMGLDPAPYGKAAKK